MKKGETPEFSAKWWKAAQPPGLRSAKKLEDALQDYELAKRGLGTDGGQKAVAAAGEALDLVEEAVKAAIDEATRAKLKPQMDITVECLKKFNFDRERSWIEDHAGSKDNSHSGDDGTGSDDEGVFAPHVYHNYLVAHLKHVSDEPIHFGFALGKKPDEHRLGIDKTQSGRALAAKIAKATGLKKLTFGTVTADEDRPATLLLELEGPQPSGLIKKGQAMLKKFGPLPFKTLALFVGGEEVQDIPDVDDVDEDGEDDEGDAPIQEETRSGPDANQLKAAMERIMPGIRVAIGAHPEHRDALMAPVTAFVGQMKIGNLAGAEQSLHYAAEALKQFGSAPPTNGGSAPLDPNLAGNKKDFEDGLKRLRSLLHTTNLVPTPTDELKQLKDNLLRAESAMKAAAGRVDYATAVKFIQPLEIAANKLIAKAHEHNAGEALKWTTATQKINQRNMSEALGSLNRNFDDVDPRAISNRDYDNEMGAKFQPGRAQGFLDEGLNPGETFRKLLEALAAFELYRTDEVAGELQRALGAYNDHFAGMNVIQRNGKDNKRKKEISDRVLQDLTQYRSLAADKAKQTRQRERLALKNDYDGARVALNSAGEPPWDPVTESALQSHHAKLMLMQGQARDGEGSPWQAAPDAKNTGESASFWVNAPTGTDKRKALFFKPLDGEDKKLGIPQGGMGAREIVSKSVSDRITSITGIEFGMPKVFATKLPRRYLAPGQKDRGGGGDPDTPRVGSMQEYIKTQGDLGAVDLKTIPKSETQKVALFDLITLNTDRNGANCLVGGVPGQTPTLVPIDQGLVLPTRRALNARSNAMTTIGGNALLSLPGANDKLSDELQAQLALLSPNDIGEAVQSGRDTLNQSLGQDGHALVDDESAKLSMRSLAFVKRAAPHLTVAEMFNALAIDGEQIFDSDDEDSDASFDKAIAATQERSKALTEIKTPPSSLGAVLKELQALGWEVDTFQDTALNLVPREAASWAKIVNGRIENPLLRRNVDEGLNELGNPPDLTLAINDLSLPEADARVRREVDKARSTAPKQNLNPRDENAMSKAFQSAGGDAVLQEVLQSFPTLGEVNSLSGEIDRVGQIKAMKLWPAYQSAGGDDAFLGFGGSSEIINIQPRIDYINSRRAYQTALKIVAEDDGFAQAFLDRVKSDLEDFPVRLSQVQNNLARANLLGQLSDIHALTDKEDFEAALPLLKAMDKALSTAGV